MTHRPLPRTLVLTAALAALFSACADPASDPDPMTLPPGDDAPTWYGDVAHVVYDECVSCHQPGGIAPFSLLDYETASAVGSLMAAATAARTMPPMPVSNAGDCNEFANARWLEEHEIALFAEWVAGGMLEGDPSEGPAVPADPPALGSVDAVLDMGEEYTPDPSYDDQLRCFVVDPGIAADVFMTGWNVLPGDPQVVHHLIVYAPKTDAAAAQAEELDAAQEGMGYDCFGGPGVPSDPLVLWAPGGGPTHLPGGTGLPVTAGRKLVMQLHYNLMAGPRPDRTRVELELAEAVERPAFFSSVADHGLELPPRESYVESSNQVPVPGGADTSVTVYGVLPHMHEMGRTLRVDLMDGADEQCMVNVDRWDFGWQNAWWYAEPIEVRGGDMLRITCGYDTLEQSDVTRWGEGTSDEMCLNYFYVTP